MGVEKLLADDVADIDTVETRTLRFTESDDVFEALSSETSRQILQWLSESPGTISEIAGDLDSSIQNVSYHIDRLERAGLVESVGTRHSPKAQEMAVYASKIESLCIQFESPEANTTTAISPETTYSSSR